MKKNQKSLIAIFLGLATAGIADLVTSYPAPKQETIKQRPPPEGVFESEEAHVETIKNTMGSVEYVVEELIIREKKEEVKSSRSTPRSQTYISFEELSKYRVPKNKVPKGWEDPFNAGNPLYHIAPILQKTPDVRVAPNFKLKEFAITGGEVLDYLRLNPEVVKKIQELRNILETPIQVTSAYRPVWRQQELVNGDDGEATQGRAAKRSQHATGNAVDLYVPGMSSTNLKQKIIETFGENTGIGVYTGTNIVHVDVRGHKSRW